MNQNSCGSDDSCSNGDTIHATKINCYNEIYSQYTKPGNSDLKKKLIRHLLMNV